MVSAGLYVCVYICCLISRSYLLVDQQSCFIIPPRSDPTENDSVEGLRPNARGPGLVTFGVSNV